MFAASEAPGWKWLYMISLTGISDEGVSFFKHSPSLRGKSPFTCLFISFSMPAFLLQRFSVFSVAHLLQFLCTNLWSITCPRLRGHLAAVDRREQLLTGPCRGGVSQAPHPKRLWRLIHCSSGPHSHLPACYCHRDQYALG